jgi:hypothetical protein
LRVGTLGQFWAKTGLPPQVPHGTLSQFWAKTDLPPRSPTGPWVNFGPKRASPPGLGGCLQAYNNVYYYQNNNYCYRLADAAWTVTPSSYAVWASYALWSLRHLGGGDLQKCLSSRGVSEL